VPFLLELPCGRINDSDIQEAVCWDLPAHLIKREVRVVLELPFIGSSRIPGICQPQRTRSVHELAGFTELEVQDVVVGLELDFDDLGLDLEFEAVLPVDQVLDVLLELAALSIE